MPKINEPRRRETEEVEQLPSEHLYPTVRVSVCIGEKALTADIAKKFLDWKFDTKEVKFGDDYLFTDENKCKIRCLNNTRNRPFNEEWSRTLAQDVLNRRWKVNLETIIIGKDGQVLSGQHRLIGLILANQIWQNGKDEWRLWKTPPTMETLVAFGADESEECTRTLDNVRPRTLADVLFTSAMFGDHRPKDRKVIVRIVDYAVRLMWQRTGVLAYKTHSEALDFIGRHPRILDAVKHVHDENGKEGNISRFISPGYAAGLLYLMAATLDYRDAYLDENVGHEDRLDLAQWDDACQFWSEFAKSGGMNPLKIKMKPQADEEEDDTILMSELERVAYVVKAWQAFMDHQPINDKTIKLEYAEKNGFYLLGEMPTIGGIDVGIKMPGQVDEEEKDHEDESEVIKPRFHSRGPKGTPAGQNPASDVRAKQRATSAG